MLKRLSLWFAVVFALCALGIQPSLAQSKMARENRKMIMQNRKMIKQNHNMATSTRRHGASKMARQNRRMIMHNRRMIKRNRNTMSGKMSGKM